MNSWIWSQEDIDIWKDKLPGNMAIPQQQTRKAEEKQVAPYLWTVTILKHEAPPSPPWLQG